MSAPISRTPSRSSTRPSLRPSLGPSPSRLAVPPALRPTQSLQGLHIHSQSFASTSSPPELSFRDIMSRSTTVDSSASSLVNSEATEGPEGILVQDVDAEVDTNEVEATGISIGDEGSKKSLRDQLRRTLSKRQPSSDNTVRARRKGKFPEIHELTVEANSRYSMPREYFVLTDAGKPVFSSRPESSSFNDSSTLGIIQALISVFLDDGDKLRCINAGATRITFLLRPPLYYVCVSTWAEPESVTRSHLEYLHLQILSVVTASQLRKIFERRGNFDLRRLLNGAETFLTSLLSRLEFDLALSTSSLHCLKLEAAIRARVAEALIPQAKMKDILYVILVARGRVVTLIRPRKHSIHPADIHILLNTIHSPSILNSPASASWIPICLPKFNPAGYVNAYISFLRKDDGTAATTGATASIPEEVTTPTPATQTFLSPVDSGSSTPSRSGAATPASSEHAISDRTKAREMDSGIALVCISGGSEFDTIRTWCDSVAQRLDTDGTLDSIALAFRTGQTEYSVAELGIPGLRHFLYKSRSQVQVTAPTFEEPYDNVGARRRLTTLYQALHDSIHGKSGQDGTLKLQYLRTDKESVMGWITQPFELYIALSPRLPKSAAVGAANAVVRWIKKEETRLFLRDAPVF